MDRLELFNTDPDLIAADLRARYELLTNKVLQPAQVEYIIFNAVAYRLSLAMIRANETANRCLVPFSDGPALDALGQLVGVKRLPAAPASTFIRFTLVAGHGALTIPAGIRVQTVDGQAVFITTESKNVLPNDDTVDVRAECTADGVVGNDYAAGAVNVILDPQAYLTAATNIDTTADGSDQETDDELRERILLAPSQFSVAGPVGAYKFFAKSAHPNIVDVAVTTGQDSAGVLIPGQVDIYPLMKDGLPPSTDIIDSILAICNDDKVRPLTDTVVVKPPVITDYSINVELILLNTAVQSVVEEKVNDNLEAYVNDRKNRLGIDVIISQIIGRCQVEGVYSVNVLAPLANIVQDPHEFANCTGVTVTVVGTHDE